MNFTFTLFTIALTYSDGEEWYVSRLLGFYYFPV